VSDSATATPPSEGPARRRPSLLHGALALAERDLLVLRRNIPDALSRSLVQPLLFVFVFTYVYPKIGASLVSSAAGAAMSTIILPGVVAFSALFCGLYAIGMPMAIDLGTTREIDDRALAPIPTLAIPIVRLISGASQAVLTSVLVFPLMFLVAVEPPALTGLEPGLLAAALLLCGLAASAIGLAVAGLVEASRLAQVMTIIHLPLTFLGAGYYPWAALDHVPWLQVLVLLNPMTYVAEALRAAITPTVPCMSPWISLPVGFLASAVLAYVGARGVARQINQIR
jgi:ABC-2 type transport system permease protein